MRDHATQSELIAQGWTVGLIDRFLGAPDDFADNPRGPHPIRLYALGRVEAEESTRECRDALRVVAERRAKREASTAKPAPPRPAKTVEPGIVEFGFGDRVAFRRSRPRPVRAS